MSGLQVWDGGGSLIFDETTPVIKFLGYLTIGGMGPPYYTGATKTGTVVDGRFTQYAGHTPFWFRVDGGISTEGYDANFSFNGNTMTWDYPRDSDGALVLNGTVYYTGRPTQTIIYGIR